MKKLFFKPLLLSSFFLLISTLDNGFKAEELVNDEITILHTIGGDDTNTTAADLSKYLKQNNYLQC